VACTRHHERQGKRSAHHPRRSAGTRRHSPPTHGIAYRGCNHEGYAGGGHITPLFEVFMGLGIDILNSIQATANDLDEVRRITQGRMALQGGISSGLVMDGPVNAIRDEVARRTGQLGQQGGYFCAPDQGMPWPPAHIEAVERAVEEFGRYPLSKAGH
jgi:hypothetical protein